MHADHRATLAQIGRGVLADVGARGIVHDDPSGLVMFRVGAGGTYRKIIIRLGGDDLYSVEYGHVDRKTFEWVSVSKAGGIYAEQLAETVRRSVGRTLSGPGR